MNFTLVKGADFSERFDFKNVDRKPISLPPGRFKMILEHGSFAREYTVDNGGLARAKGALLWSIPGHQSKDFEFTVMYYILYLENQEIARGILRVQ